MSVDMANKMIQCDGEGCFSTTQVPITYRHWYDHDSLELRSESSAAGWTFMAARGYDKHYCPLCSDKYFSPKRNMQAV